MTGCCRPKAPKTCPLLPKTGLLYLRPKTGRPYLNRLLPTTGHPCRRRRPIPSPCRLSHLLPKIGRPCHPKLLPKTE